MALGLRMIPKRIVWMVVLLIVAVAAAAVFRFVSRPASFNPAPSPEQHIHAMAVNPADGQLYAGTHRGLYVSRDRGRSWAPISHITVSSAELDLMAFVILPGRPPVLYGAGHGFGVVKSLDGGAAWERVNEGLPSSLDVHALAASRGSPTDSPILYASVVDGGIYRSDDGAAHWRRIEARFDNGPVMALALDPMRPAVLYAAGHGIGILKTTNGGLAWTPLGLADPNIMTVMLDPSRPDHLMAGGRGGIYTSMDAGVTWSRLSLTGTNPSVLMTAIAQDPSDPLTVYAAAETGQVWLSRDGGGHWAPQSAAP